MMSTPPDLIPALALPTGCRVDQRVPKKLLLENGAPTTADKRRINDGIESLQWLAALKPNTIGVPEYRDTVREYVEVAVLSVSLRVNPARPVSAARLAELIHRAVPYPVVLLLCSPPRLMLSLAHKRWAQNEAGKVVLDGDPVSVTLRDAAASPAMGEQFTQALALSRQPQTHLLALYQGWIDCLQALRAARYTGTFQPLNSPQRAAARREALQACQQLETEASRLRTQATKEKQLARQVELNLALKRVQAQLAEVRKAL